MTVVAVNIEPRSPLEEWVSFWKGTGAGEVLWGQDVNGTTVRDYRLVALGTEVIVTLWTEGPRVTARTGHHSARHHPGDKGRRFQSLRAARRGPSALLLIPWLTYLRAGGSSAGKDPVGVRE